MGQAVDIIQNAKDKIKGKKLRLVLPEGNDSRIISAAQILQEEDLAIPILLRPDGAEADAETVSVLVKKRTRLTQAMAARLLRKPLYAGGAMVETGQADAMLAGVSNPTARVIEAALLTIGLAKGNTTPSSFFLMQWPDRVFIFADCAVNVQPSAEQLADIGIAAANSASRLLGQDPRVAMLSFSTKGSAKHADADKVIEACRLAQARAPHFHFDGELQGDAALSEAVAQRKIGAASAVAGTANVLVFPDLDAGNIAYKLCQYLGGAQAIGPILQGFARPVSDLSRGASVKDILETAVILLSMV